MENESPPEDMPYKLTPEIKLKLIDTIEVFINSELFAANDSLTLLPPSITNIAILLTVQDGIPVIKEILCSPVGEGRSNHARAYTILACLLQTYPHELDSHILKTFFWNQHNITSVTSSENEKGINRAAGKPEKLYTVARKIIERELKKAQLEIHYQTYGNNTTLQIQSHFPLEISQKIPDARVKAISLEGLSNSEKGFLLLNEEGSIALISNIFNEKAFVQHCKCFTKFEFKFLKALVNKNNYMISKTELICIYMNIEITEKNLEKIDKEIYDLHYFPEERFEHPYSKAITSRMNSVAKKMSFLGIKIASYANRSNHGYMILTSK